MHVALASDAHALVVAWELRSVEVVDLVMVEVVHLVLESIVPVVLNVDELLGD